MLLKSVEEECSIIFEECSIISMFLTSFNVYFVFGNACFMCICLKATIRLFLGQGLAFYGEDRLADLRKNVQTALFKKPEIFENCLGIPACNQRAAGA